MELNLSHIQRLLLVELMESSSSDDSSSSSSDSYDDDQDLLLQCYAQSIHKEDRPKVVDYIQVVEAYTDHEVCYIRHIYLQIASIILFSYSFAETSECQELCVMTSSNCLPIPSSVQTIVMVADKKLVQKFIFCHFFGRFI